MSVSPSLTRPSQEVRRIELDEGQAPEHGFDRINSLWNSKESALITGFPKSDWCDPERILQRLQDDGRAQLDAHIFRKAEPDSRSRIDDFIPSLASELATGMERSRLAMAETSDRQQFVRAFRDRLAVHVAIRDAEVMIPELGPYFAEHFAPTLDTILFRGYVTKISTWVSASGNVYPRHNDHGDGLLIQVHGRKVITLFDVPDEYYAQTIFDHSFGSQPDPYPLPSRECHLEPGQALFIPRGMPHQVAIPAGEQSVAISFRAEGIYPLLDLCDDVNALAGKPESFHLSESDSRTEKPLLKYFDPYAHAAPGPETDHMPLRLKEALLTSLVSATPGLEADLPDLLDRWWAGAARRQP